MARSKLPAIQIAVWPSNGGTRYWGAVDYTTSSYDSCTSTWLSLRAVKHDGYMTDAERCIADFGVYLWLANDGCITLELKLHDVHSASMGDMERLMRTFKTLQRKLDKGYKNNGNFVRDSNLYVELTAFFKALGVQDECVAYHGIGAPDSTVPLAELVRRVAETMGSISLKQKEAA